MVGADRAADRPAGGGSGAADAGEAAEEGRRLQAELPPDSNVIPSRNRDRISEWFPGPDPTTGLIVLAVAAIVAVARWPARFIERAMQPKRPKAR